MGEVFASHTPDKSSVAITYKNICKTTTKKRQIAQFKNQAADLNRYFSKEVI
jgi:hypothetical protein